MVSGLSGYEFFQRTCGFLIFNFSKRCYHIKYVIGLIWAFYQNMPDSIWTINYIIMANALDIMCVTNV